MQQFLKKFINVKRPYYSDMKIVNIRLDEKNSNFLDTFPHIVSDRLGDDASNLHMEITIKRCVEIVPKRCVEMVLKKHGICCTFYRPIIAVFF